MAHTVPEAIGLIDEALAACADAVMYGLPDKDVEDLTVRCEQVKNRLDGLLWLPLIAELHGRDLRKPSGDASTASWLTNRLRIRPSVAAKLVKTAAATMDGPYAATGRALAAGEISADHAGVIDVSLKKLPSDVDSAQKAKAEQTMLDNARTFDPFTLERLGSHLYATIAPEDASRREERELEKQQRRAEQSRWASWHSTGGPGVVELRLRTDAETKAKLEAMYLPQTGPRTQPDGSPDTRPFQRRAGDAITELIHSMYGTELPDNPVRKHPELLIGVDYDHVTGKLGAGTLDTGVKLSPKTMAKLACEARLTPVWMTRGLRPIAVAATSRYFKGAHLEALHKRDRGCAFPGCDRPIRFTHAHHITAFRISGITSADDGVLLCHFHHQLIHQGDWVVRIAADGLPEFRPPPWVDPTQAWRRHQRHQR